MTVFENVAFRSRASFSRAQYRQRVNEASGAWGSANFPIGCRLMWAVSNSGWRWRGPWWLDPGAAVG